MGNRTHVSTYGYRDRECPRCKVLLRKEDFTDGGICTWCAWELDEPVRALLARMDAQKTLVLTTKGRVTHG